MPNLTDLSLSFNKIERMESGVFNGLGRLQSLDLSGNRFEEWPVSCLPSLVVLNLSQSENRELDMTKFEGLVNLRQLDLSHNYFDSLNLSEFKTTHLANLMVLNLE
jgi:Leucine-rich repeat (LRR) protein